MTDLCKTEHLHVTHATVLLQAIEIDVIRHTGTITAVTKERVEKKMYK